jgi:hypothetical protein
VASLSHRDNSLAALDVPRIPRQCTEPGEFFILRVSLGRTLITGGKSLVFTTDAPDFNVPQPLPPDA